MKLKKILKLKANYNKNAEKLQNNFVDSVKKINKELLQEQNPSKSYLFVVNFGKHRALLKNELDQQAKIVYESASADLVGNLYSLFDWIPVDFYFKAKQDTENQGYWGTSFIIDGLFKRGYQTFLEDYKQIVPFVCQYGNEYECYNLAKVSHGRILSNLENRFLKICNNCFEILNFSYLKNVDKNKFLKRMLDIGFVDGAQDLIDSAGKIILEQSKRDKKHAEESIKLCMRSGRSKFAFEIAKENALSLTQKKEISSFKKIEKEKAK